VTDYILVQNNVFFDSSNAINGGNGNTGQWSIIGNLLFDIGEANDTGKDATGISLSGGDNHEVYLNTIINATGEWAVFGSGGTNQDIRCNVIINSAAHSGTPGTNSEVDWNAYYNVSGTKLDTNLFDRSTADEATIILLSGGD